MLIMSGKREQNRVEMCKRILDAAEKLVLEKRSTDFSMSQLSETAGVAQVTPYKHFETKAGVLAALLQQLLSGDPAIGVDREPSVNQIDRIMGFVAGQAKSLVEHEELTRPILSGLARLDENSPYMAGEQWEPRWLAIIEPAFDAGLLHDFANPGLAARALHMAFYGACKKWQAYESSSEQLVNDACYCTAIILLGIASEIGQPVLRHRFAEVEMALLASLNEKNLSDARSSTFHRA